MKKYITHDARRLAYADIGHGDVPVVLIHGFCGSTHYWKPIIPSLSSHVRVIAPDLRGHGESTDHALPFDISDLASDMQALLEHLGIERAHIWGHSLGGYTALAFAERYTDCVASLSLIHSTAFPDTAEGQANREKGIAIINEQGIRAYVDGLVPRLFAPAHLSTMRETVQNTLEIGYETQPQAAAHTMAAMRDRPDRNSVLEQLEVPILLIAGESDQVFPPERVFSIARPNIRHELLREAGHMSMLECPDQLNRILLEFLKTSQ